MAVSGSELPARRLTPCPLCDPSASAGLSLHASFSCYTCKACGPYVLDEELVLLFKASFQSNKVTVRSSDFHLVGGYTREQGEIRERPVCLDITTYAEVLSQCPRTVREKADKLLTAVHRKTEFFGQAIPLTPETDYRLGYAKNTVEFFALIHFLSDNRLVTYNAAGGVLDTKITAAGFDAIESRLLSPAVTVFLSSTCYDLVDLRAELADFLESKGFIVRASDDAYRIELEPTEDTITTCLRNVETADVVVCILDQRYGPPLPPEKKFSATHAEILHARELKKAVYIFARDKALYDFDQLRKVETAKTRWVEPDNDDRRKSWLAFAKELEALIPAQSQGHSNWIDPFRDSVQLKKLVLRAR